MFRVSLCVFLSPCAAWPSPEVLSDGKHWRSVGNHRYEIRVPPDARPHAAFTVNLPWRRGDPSPEAKGTVLLDAVSAQEVSHCRRLNVSGEEGRFAFSGVPGGVYHLYYMPFETCEFRGGACQFGQNDKVEGMVQYRAYADSCSTPVWWKNGDSLEILDFEQQSRTEFDAFGAMEVAATAAEVATLMEPVDKFLLVTEDRSRAVRMRHHLPASWATRASEDLSRFSGIVQPGEKYTFQIAIVPLVDIEVRSAVLIEALSGPDGAKIPTTALRCLNLQGTDFWGQPFTTTASVNAAEVLALWFVLEVPTSVSQGHYSGSVSLTTTLGTKSVSVDFEVQGAELPNGGDDDVWRGTRLSWLDSTLANEGDVPPPYHALSDWSDGNITMLDKAVSISAQGMPASVSVGGHEALASPVRFDVLSEGAIVPITFDLKYKAETDLVHSWSGRSQSSELVTVEMSGSVDATGYMDFNLSVDTTSNHEIRLVVPSVPENAVYAAGLGRTGGLLSRWTNTSQPVVWHWDGINHNSAVWVGSTRAGLRVYPKGDDPMWQAMVPFDSDEAPPTPESWSNGGKGGVRVWPNGTMEVFTGRRDAGRSNFLFSIMATPTRPVNLPKHFGERYAQISKPANYSFLREGGATVVNLHQGNVVNPWINYPYLTHDLMKQAADECHALGMRFKVYNTMRELSNHAVELWAMRSLNETFVWREGEGGGGDWLREHLHGDYSVAWATPMAQSGFFSSQIDQAIKVKALSRWNNYYVEGMRQLIHETGCDGIYLDEIAYDRVTMLRTKAVLGKDRLVDHHSCHGQFAKTPVTVYTEAFPFIDSLWYGEQFDYDGGTPDHWLVEMSGIPFGLNADLLRYSGDTPFHFRGMLFANANRWQDNLDQREGSSSAFDPRAIWKLWDEFGIESSTMHGWWLAEEGSHAAPITVNSTDVKCTVFTKANSALIVLANFGVAQPVQLIYDWGALGFEKAGKQLRAPKLEPMQPESHIWSVDDVIPMPAPERGSPESREGWLIVLEPVSTQNMEVLLV